MWNSGYFTTYSTHSVCVGLYLCVLSGTNYEPPFVRDYFASIDDQQHNAFSVYPNPATDYISIKSPENATFSAVLIDLNGRTVWERNNVSSSEKIDLSSVESGAYFLNLHFEDQSVQSKPIIIQ